MRLNRWFYDLNIKTKVNVVLLAIIAFIILTGIVFEQFSRNRNIYIKKSQIAEQTETVKTLLRLKSAMYSQIVKDYSCYDQLIEFIAAPDTAWSSSNITVLESFSLQKYWIMNLNREVIDMRLGEDFNLTLDIPNSVIDTLHKNRTVEYYHKLDSGIIQILGSTVHPSSDLDRLTEPQGYFLLAKYWDNSYIQELANLSNTNITLKTEVTEDEYLNEVVFPLNDYNGNAAIYLTAFKDNPLMNKIQEINSYISILILAGAILLAILFYFSFQNIIIKAIESIIKALNLKEASHLEKLLHRKDEFSVISNLIVEFFNQQSQLINEIEERKAIQEELETVIDELQLRNDEIEAQRDELSKQRDIITLKNKLFTDSLFNALRIQKALIPPADLLQNLLPEHFIFSKPRDVVSGDFYWVKKTNGYLYGAVADATGHGVSGAFMSILGVSLLNQIVTNNCKLTPAEVLNEMRTRLIRLLHQKNDRSFTKDGYDMALCRFKDESNILEYAGAYSPLHIVRKTEDDSELIEYKANRFPVGIYPKELQPFTDNLIELKPNDRIYLSSDGYTSQIGGPHQRKYSTTQYKDFLYNIQHLPLKKQQEVFDQNLSFWMENYEQVDDILVVAIEISKLKGE